MRWIIPAFAVVIAILPVQVWAWGGDGHRVVCAVAWHDMTTATRRAVESLLDVRGRDGFAGICNWADEYRDQGHRETSPWHSVNVPAGATTIDLARDCAEPRTCVVVQIMRDIAILQDDAPPNEQAIAVKYVAHFVGDVHQPLHANHVGDRGGSALKGDFMGKPTDMHAVWDFDLIENTHRSWQQIADLLVRRITPAERRVWSASQPLDWANESLAIANDPATAYVGVESPFHLGADYQRRELPVVYDRLSRAGVRLAHVLNAAFDKDASWKTPKTY